jgi:hypothetical protein
MANEIGNQMQPAAGALGGGTPPKTQEEFVGLRNSWMDFLTRPETTAALLQFGASVLQPVGRGQSVLGNVGLAAADAGAAAGRVGAQAQAREQAALEAEQKNRQISVQERTAAANEAQTAAQIKAGEAGLAFDEKKLASDFKVELMKLGIEEKKANAYAASVARMGASSTPGSLRDKMYLEAMKTLGRMAQNAGDLGDDFDYATEAEKLTAGIEALLATQGVGTAGGTSAPASTAGATTGTETAPVSVNTLEEAMALAPGTLYKAPDGVVRKR